MADQRTEKPTQRRLDRARKEGNFPASREFVGAVHFITVVALVSLFTAGFFSRLLLLSRRLFAFAFTGSLSARQVVALARNLIAPDFLPLIFGGLTLTVVVIAIQLGTTKLGISPQKLAPDFKRLNPLPKLTGLPGQNLPIFFQALLLLPLVGVVLYYELTENLNAFMELPWLHPRSAITRIGGTLETLLWRAARARGGHARERHGLRYLQALASRVIAKRRVERLIGNQQHVGCLPQTPLACQFDESRHLIGGE